MLTLAPMDMKAAGAVVILSIGLLANEEEHIHLEQTAQQVAEPVQAGERASASAAIASSLLFDSIPSKCRQA